MRDKVISSVKETTDYNKFKFLEENREITDKALTKIKKSVEKDGWRNYPITVNEKMEIIEGQHTYMFAKENNLPLRYYVQEGATKKDCQIINSARTSWKLTDYIHSYAQSGNVSFKFLEILVNRYSPAIPVSAISFILFGDHGTAEIREGKFKCTAEDYNNTSIILNYMEKFIPYIEIIGGRKTVMFDALTFAYHLPNIDKDRLFQSIKKNCHSMTPPASTEIALAEIERVYNRKLNYANRIYIATEYKKRKGVQKKWSY